MREIGGRIMSRARQVDPEGRLQRAAECRILTSRPARPDGETIVFDYLGDLFTIPIAGGDATQLTSGMAFDAQPRFSPDGSRIVYTSDADGGQNVWIRSLDGSETKQISKGGANRAESPEWMPDGDYVVASMGDFRGRALPKLKLFHVDGGSGIQPVSEPDDLKMLGPAVSPDGRYVWYSRRTGDWTCNAQFPQYQLEAYDTETGERYTRSSRYGSAIRPTLSPDGRWLVFGTRHEEHTGLVLRDLRTGGERWLSYPVQHDDQESRATLDVLPGMSFTPDSRHLVVSYGGKIRKLPIAGGPAEEIPFRVRFDLALGPRVDFDYPVADSPTFTVRQIRDAAPAPGGDRLAFTALDRLWVSGADGAALVVGRRAGGRAGGRRKVGRSSKAGSSTSDAALREEPVCVFTIVLQDLHDFFPGGELPFAFPHGGRQRRVVNFLDGIPHEVGRNADGGIEQRRKVFVAAPMGKPMSTYT